MPDLGKFVLHSNVLPDLKAGEYTVHVDHDIDADGVAIPDLDAHIEVTAPRFSLPPDQILSTFPPNQSRGAFSSRLPQIVLKRRTLPWERTMTNLGAPLPSETPWLALVLLADGEGELLTQRPVGDCVTAGTSVAGRQDVEVANAISVTQEIIDEVFPAQDEIALLTHVREVNIADTELMMGDDDAWLSVVVCNRLPQPGVQYRACLISLEGQFHRLPTAHLIEDETRWGVSAPSIAYSPALDALRRSIGAGGSVEALARAPSEAERFAPRDAWAGRLDVSSAHVAAGGPLASVLGAASALALSRRFPLLAHWTFTCTEAGDFESRMRALEVGMIGTLRPPPVATARKPAPIVKPPPEVLDTGHVALRATSRHGDASTVWYRGPLTPRIAARESADEDGRLPVTHVSDQAWITGPDGRGNATRAAAFEIGRLLALTDPSFVAALLVWRNRGFELARRRALVGGERLLSLVPPALIDRGLGFAVGRRLLAELGADDAIKLGTLRPVIDPVPDLLPGIDVRTTLVDGLHLEPAVADALLAGEVVAPALIAPAASHPVTIDDPTAALGNLRGALEAARRIVLRGVEGDL